MKKQLIALMFVSLNASGAIQFSDVDPNPLSSTASDYLYIRDFLTISNGSQLTNRGVKIGATASNYSIPSVLTVTDPNSMYTVSFADVGSDALLSNKSGAVHVLNGGSLNVESIQIRDAACALFNSEGCENYVPNSVTVSGQSSLLNAGTFANGSYVEAAPTSIRVHDGGVIQSENAYLGGEFDAKVFGNNARWETGLLNADSSSANGLHRVAIGSGGTIVADAVVFDRSDLVMEGGTLTAPTILLRSESLSTGSTIVGFGTIVGGVDLRDATHVVASGGTLELGDTTKFNAVRIDGEITIAAEATLRLNTKLSFSRLAQHNELLGGTLDANTGVLLDAASTLVGTGAVSTRFAALAGSAVSATGDLSIGNSLALDGYFSDGILEVNNSTVTLNDANAAVMGSLTVLGNGLGAGTLISSNGLLLDFGKNISGHGHIFGDLLNNGYIEGEGLLIDDAIELHGLVSGVGGYGGTVIFSGTLSPGFSPAEIALENLVTVSETVIEVAGKDAGHGFDYLNARGTAKLGGKLRINLLNGFHPEAGDRYTFLTALGGISGQFESVVLPQVEGMTFDIVYEPFAVSLTASVAVPVPGAFSLLVSGLGITLVSARRRVRSRRNWRDSALNASSASCSFEAR